MPRGKSRLSSATRHCCSPCSRIFASSTPTPTYCSLACANRHASCLTSTTSLSCSATRRWQAERQGHCGQPAIFGRQHPLPRPTAAWPLLPLLSNQDLLLVRPDTTPTHSLMDVQFARACQASGLLCIPMLGTQPYGRGDRRRTERRRPYSRAGCAPPALPDQFRTDCRQQSRELARRDVPTRRPCEETARALHAPGTTHGS
jgi:hypothetical protein